MSLKYEPASEPLHMLCQGFGSRLKVRLETLASLSLRLKDLLGPVTRVKKKGLQLASRCASRWVQGSGFCQGSGFRVQHSRCGVQGLGIRVEARLKVGLETADVSP